MSTAKAPPEEAATLGYLLRTVYDSLQDRVYAAVAAAGHPELRDVHSPVLRHLPPEGARVTDIARLADLAKQSVAYVVDDLVRLGYVAIEPDPADGRAKLVKLTVRGRALTRSLLEHSAAAERDLAAAIGGRKVETLRQALRAAAIELSTHRDAAPPRRATRPPR